MNEIINDGSHKVIVVGAGPTGLMLACELKLMGVDVAIIERRDHGTTGESRAPGINARTMEILKMRGLAEKFEQLGQRLNFVLFSGMPLNPKAMDPAWPNALILPQHETERLLAERAKELGVTIYWSTELLHLFQDQNEVDVLVKRNGKSEHFRAEYVAGCDGGHSAVRKLCGAVFTGEDPISHWIVADVQLNAPPGEKGTFGRNSKIGTYQVSSVEPGWYRVNLMKLTPPADRSAPVTLEELRTTMIEGIGTDFGLNHARWMSRYSDGFRQATAYRFKRVFLLGDAAHTHSPIGGQGLNLGIQDAVNLGWKLSAVLNYNAADTLLDSFQDERHPVAADVMQLAKAQTALIKIGEQIEALRSVVGDMIKVPEITLQLSGKLSGLDLRYGWGEGKHLLIGRRIPNLSLSINGGRSELFSLMRDGRPVLLSFNRQTDIQLSEALQERINWIDVITDKENDLAWMLPVIGEVPAPGNVFIRPDGYIAWVRAYEEAYDFEDLNEVLNRWLG